MEAPPARSILHIDMDCFYVSVERLRDPSLVGKPVAVGGTPDGRGVVASASYEARAFGVRAAMPMSVAIRLCPQLVAVQGFHSRYSEVADEIHATLDGFSPVVQMASQDEAYVDLTGTERLWGPATVAAQSIRDAVVRRTNLPCSVGLGSSKLVSKVASDLCKPRGFLAVPHGSEESFLAPLPTRRLPGVGPRTEERLAAKSLRLIGDIAATPAEELSALFGVHGLDLHRAARGIGSSEVEQERIAKSIGAEETLDRDTTDPEVLDGLLANLCEKVAYRLRGAGCHAGGVTLKYRYDDFETHTAARMLAAPTNDDSGLLAEVRALLSSHSTRSRPIRLLGVQATHLLFGERQLDLLADPGDGRRERLLAAIDDIRGRHGYGAVRRASSTGRHEEKNDKQWG